MAEPQCAQCGHSDANLYSWVHEGITRYICGDAVACVSRILGEHSKPGCRRFLSAAISAISACGAFWRIAQFSRFSSRA